MLESHLDYIESYSVLSPEEKSAHKAMLESIIDSLEEPSGKYPVILGLLLAEKTEFTILLNGTAEPLEDADFKKNLRSEYKNAVYAYQKRIAIICELCLEDKSLQYRFCGNFTSFDNIDCIAELLSVPFGVLRRLQKTAEGRRQISRVRSCAVKMRTTIDHMQSLIDGVKTK